jgi:hypothetical protein
MDGAPNRIVIRAGTPAETEVLQTAFEEPLSAGHVTFAAMGGGGGWGDPLERDPAAVLEDVLDEYVSLEGARRDYGVVIDEQAMKVDHEATARLREEMAEERARQQKEVVRAVPYLSPEWQELCQEAVNRDPEFAELAGDLTMDVNNVIEDCPEGETRFLYWRFRNGKLSETSVGTLDELGSREATATTLASYDTFMKINTAKLTIEKAVTEGRIRFEGDLAKMIEYTEALNRFTEVRRGVPTEY